MCFLLSSFPACAQLFQHSDLWHSPHFFPLQVDFTSPASFAQPFQSLSILFLPFTTGCPLLHSDLESSVKSSSDTWHVWNNGGHLPLRRQQISLLLFNSGCLGETVLRNMLKVVADLVLGAWSPSWLAAESRSSGGCIAWKSQKKS